MKASLLALCLLLSCGCIRTVQVPVPVPTPSPISDVLLKEAFHSGVVELLAKTSPYSNKSGIKIVERLATMPDGTPVFIKVGDVQIPLFERDCTVVKDMDFPDRSPALAKKEPLESPKDKKTEVKLEPVIGTDVPKIELEPVQIIETPTTIPEEKEPAVDVAPPSPDLGSTIFPVDKITPSKGTKLPTAASCIKNQDNSYTLLTEDGKEHVCRLIGRFNGKEGKTALFETCTSDREPIKVQVSDEIYVNLGL